MGFDAVDPPLAERRIPAGGDWLSSEALAALTPERLVERMTALKPRIAAAAAEAERLRRPVDEIWDAIRAAGYFYQYVPRAFGGLEVTTDQFIDATLPIAEACASTGWAASFCAEHNWFLSHWPAETQAELFGSGRYIVAPVVSTPLGKAVRIDGGYRVNARWKWGTGVMHADWIMGSALVAAAGDAPPRVMTFLFPAAEADVLDTWQVCGMAGTGSNDIAVNDLFVPAARAVAMDLLLNGRGPGSRGYARPLYDMPMLPFLALTAAISAVGAARAALAAYRERLETIIAQGSQTRTADKLSNHIRLGRADVMIDTALLAIRQAGRDNLALGALQGAEQIRGRLKARAQIAHAVALCREAVTYLGEAAGSTAQMLDNPFQRAVRDLNVIASHVVFDVDVAYELQGRGLLGLPPNATLI